MVSNSQLSWRFDGLFMVGILVLLGRLRSSKGDFVATDWTYAHATFYGDDSASETMGGACGYGNLMNTGYGTDTAALSTTLFNNGYACGSCYEIKCVESPWCNDNGGSSGYGRTIVPSSNPTIITVTATNLCPPNYYQANDDGGWCNPPLQHFDLAKPAYDQIAATAGGIVPVMYRRVPCGAKGGIRFYFEGNPYWLLVYVMNVGGSGEVSQMSVKGSNQNQWITMSHNWGASYQAFGQLGSQSLSFQLVAGNGDTIIANNVTPQYWCVGVTYEADINFQ